MNITEIKSKLGLDCVQSLLQILNQFVDHDEELKSHILEKGDDIVVVSLRYIHLIGKYTLLVEQMRGESFDDIQIKRKQSMQQRQKVKQL